MSLRKRLTPKSKPARVVVEAELVGGGLLRLEMGVPDDLVEMTRVLEPEIELAQVRGAKAATDGTPQPQVIGDSKQSAGPRDEVLSVTAVVVEAAAQRDREAVVNGDTVVEPEVDHGNALTGVVSKNPVVSPVLILSPLHAALEKLPAADHLRHRAVEAVEALVEIGGVVDFPRLTEDIQSRTLIILAVVTAQVPLSQRRKADVHHGAVVLGAIVGECPGGSKGSLVPAFLLIDKGIGHGP